MDMDEHGCTIDKHDSIREELDNILRPLFEKYSIKLNELDKYYSK